MEKKEVIKALKAKSAAIDVSAFTDRNGYLIARVAVKLVNEGTGLVSTISLSCQANEIALNPDSTRGEAKNPWRSFTGYTGFYALSANYSLRCFDSWESESKETIEALFSIVRSIVEAKNLGYVSPDCELSLFCRAMETLGTSIFLEVNGGSLAEFNRKQREKQN